MAMVIPSIYDTGNGSRQPFDGGMYSNDKLRIGIIKHIYEVDDDFNINKRVREYSALVQHSANGTAETKMADHLTLMESFGGGVDRFSYTLREDEQQLGLGARVLILCIGGESLNGVIIGSIRSDKSDRDRPSEDAPNLHFRFNGVNVDINSDGELSLSIKGATDIQGNIDNEVNTTVTIDKDKNINITNGGDLNINTTGTANIIASQVMLGDKDLQAETQGVVLARGIDTLTGSTYGALQSASMTVLAKD